MEMQIRFWVTVKCPQAESQRKISETERDLKRFQFLLFLFWSMPSTESRSESHPSAFSTGRRRSWRFCITEKQKCEWWQKGEQSICRGIHWSVQFPRGSVSKHRGSHKRTEHFCRSGVCDCSQSQLVRVFHGAAALPSGTHEKQRAGQDPDARRARKSPRQGLWGSAEIFVQWLGKDDNILLQTWHETSSAACPSVQVSTEPVTGSVGAGCVCSLALVLHIQLSQMETVVYFTADNLRSALDPLSLKQPVFFVSLLITSASSPWSAFLPWACYWLFLWPANS